MGEEGELLAIKRRGTYILLDWICPICRENVDMRASGRAKCPKCGLNALERPIIKKSIERPIKLQTFKLKRWAKFARKHGLDG
jgi:tRNA(Ile2) C34 agmatinyltransferase TiaS